MVKPKQLEVVPRDVPLKSFLLIVLALNLALIVFSTALGIYKTGNPSRYFGEGRFTTAFSCLQLLLAGLLAWKIFLLRKPHVLAKMWFNHSLLWALIAIGFVFLSLDEALEIHEWMDRFIHRHILQHKPTAVTDRLDDAIIGFYAFAGIWVLYLCRRELKLFGAILPYLLAGFAFTFVSVFFDVLGNRSDVLEMIVKNELLARRLEGWSAVFESAAMFIAEGLFVFAFFCGVRIAGDLAALNQPPRSTV